MGLESALRSSAIVCDTPEVSPDASCSSGLIGYGVCTPVTNRLGAMP